MKAKRIGAKELRSLILKETKKARGPRGLAYYLFEQDENEGQKSKGELGDAPRGDAVDQKTNLKDVDPIEIANQLLSGDDSAPVIKASDGWFNGQKAKAWIENLGPEVFIKRLKFLASKIPDSGLPKSMMPFLPGPGDAKGSFEELEDALKPGGKMNIDFMKEGRSLLAEKTPPPSPNEFTGYDPELKKGKAAAFLTGGLKDGNPTDDDTTVEKGGDLGTSEAIPTQSNILIVKTLGFAIGGMKGGPLNAWASTDNEILDGHHRWAGTMLNDPDARMGTAGKVDLGVTGDKKEMLKYLTALGNALGNETKTEIKKSNDQLVMERWQKLSGLLND